MAQEIVRIGHSDLTARMFGVCDAHVKAVEAAFGVDIRNRSDVAGDTVLVSGLDAQGVRLAAIVMERLKDPRSTRFLSDRHGAGRPRRGADRP